MGILGTFGKLGESFRGVAEEAGESWEANVNVNRSLQDGGLRDRRFRGPDRSPVTRGLMTYHDTMLGAGQTWQRRAVGYGVPGAVAAGLGLGAAHENNQGDALGATVLGSGAAVMGGALALAGFGRVAEANIGAVARNVIAQSKGIKDNVADFARNAGRSAESGPVPSAPASVAVQKTIAEAAPRSPSVVTDHAGQPSAVAADIPKLGPFSPERHFENYDLGTSPRSGKPRDVSSLKKPAEATFVYNDLLRQRDSIIAGASGSLTEEDHGRLGSLDRDMQRVQDIHPNMTFPGLR